MEEWVRVQNERDRKVLVWLRGQASDTAIATAARACAWGDSKPYLSAVCRQLGLKAPIMPSKSPTSEAVGERHLAAMYEILRARTDGVRPGRRFQLDALVLLGEITAF
jgi:hypothetical protein